MSESVIELHDVAVSYDGRTVLAVQHLALHRGEILTLLGENGSGKTTLLRLLGLLIRPDRGSVLLDGEEVDFDSARRLLELRRRMAAVMQNPLLCRMSVERNVALGLRFRGVPKPEIESQVNAWLERLSILHLGGRSASKLSGGEAQRTSLARAMVLDPDVLFLDEPFGALDAPTRQSMLQEFKGLLGDSGLTTVFATHDRGEALVLGDRVAVLSNGRVVQLDSLETVFTRPKQVATARFVGIETIVAGRVTGVANGLVKVDCGDICIEAVGDCEEGESVHVAVRSEEIVLHDGESLPATSGRNTFPGRVTKIVPAETHYRVEVDCGVQMVAAVSRVRYRNLVIDVGRKVEISFASLAAHVIRSV